MYSISIYSIIIGNKDMDTLKFLIINLLVAFVMTFKTFTAESNVKFANDNF